MSPRKGDMDADFSHTLSGGRTGLPALLDALETHLSQAGAPMAVASAVMIAADEVLSNVVDHGGATTVQVSAGVRDRRVTVEVVDDGVPFDPTAARAPDTSLGIEEREVGGLGVHLVRKLMDEVAYRRDGGRNKLRFSRAYDLMSPSPP
jgi:anti-sigma regulatory factor (Ser/Thr protein kinase)